MTQQIAGMSTRIGTCPHGMPIGACPICNGTGGGGGMSSRAADTARKPGEMSWSQCFAQGMIMKQTQERAEARQNSALYNVDIATNLKNITNFVNNSRQAISVLQNSLPPSAAKVFNAINQAILTPLLNLIDKIPKLVQTLQKGIENIRDFISKVAEKLTAFFGEVKNFVNKKISDFIKMTKKKFFGFLFPSEDDEEEMEAKSIFEVFQSSKEQD